MTGTRASSTGRFHFPGLSGGGISTILRMALLCVAAAALLGGFSRPAGAMFVASPEKEEEPLQTEENPVADQERLKSDARSSGEQASALPGGAAASVIPQDSPETTLPEDTNLRKEISRIMPPPADSGNVNSNAFARMSGETQKLRPVALPVRLVDQKRLLRRGGAHYQDPGGKIISVGSWIFIVLCLAATLAALFRIRRLSSRPA